MNQRERLDPKTENLLWQLSSLPSKTADRALDDELIERYRRGALPAGDSRGLERRLAADGRAMERMAQLAAQPAARRQPALRLAASILVGAIATTALFLSLRGDGVDPELSDLPPYTVSVYGLSERRGPEPSHETRSGSTVRIVARPAVVPGPGLDVALYRRLESGALARIAEADGRIEIERGTAVLEAEAGALIGSEPGLYELVLLIGPAGGPPAPASIAGLELEERVREPRAQALTLEIRLLPTPPR